MTRKKAIFGLLVVAAAAVFLRLAFWQYSRHLEKRSENQAIRAQLALPPLQPNDQANLPNYRRVSVAGEFDYQNQILLKNRTHEGRNGYHLITPLRMEGSARAVLVDRGWIPLDRADDEFEAEPPIRIDGITLPSQNEPGLALLADPTLGPGQERLDAWRVLDISRIQEQTPYELLPYYVKLAQMENSSAGLPIPKPDFEISEGSHLGYTAQWVAFALIALVGGFYWMRKN